MLQRALATLLCLLGIAAVGLAVASATVWRPADALVASVQAADGLVATDPGVLDLAAKSVTLSATSASGEVVLAIGHAEDVTAWVGETAVTRVTGLASRTALASSSGAATPAPLPAPSVDAAASADPSASPEASAGSSESTEQPEPTATEGAGAADETELPPNPDGSDLWVEQAVGARSATLSWSGGAGRWSAIAAATEGGPVTLELTWPQEVTTPWQAPGIAVGSLLLLAGLTWWTRLLLRGHRPDAVLGLVATVAARRGTPDGRRVQRGSASGQHHQGHVTPVSDDAPAALQPSPAVPWSPPRAPRAPEVTADLAPTGAPLTSPTPSPAPTVWATVAAPSSPPPSAEPGAEPVVEPVATTRRALREQRERAEQQKQASANRDQQQLAPGQVPTRTDGAPAHRTDAPTARPAQRTGPPAAAGHVPTAMTPAGDSPAPSASPSAGDRDPDRARPTAAIPEPGPIRSEVAAGAQGAEPEPRRRRFPFAGRRQNEAPAPTPSAPAVRPEASPPPQEPTAVAGTTSADAWRRAWGLPSGGSTWIPGDGPTDGPPDEARSANPEESR